MGEAAIEVQGLRKTYGDLEAVRGIDLRVEPGEVFAFLGPNGAGKTTTVEILEGYRQRDGGEVTVLGLDPASPTRDWRERIGIVLQTNRMHPLLTVRETFELYAGYYRSPRPVGETLDRVGLSQKADDRVGTLSGGQQRRVDVGVALVGDPDLLFLDEPTTGFDPSARRQAWSLIAGLQELGKTVFLTTHYMDEAQALASRVAIIVAGQIVATGAPDDLGDASAPTRISFAVGQGAESGDLPSHLQGPASNGLVELQTTDPVQVLHDLTGWALERGVDVKQLDVSRPSLEDVYLELADQGPGENS